MLRCSGVCSLPHEAGNEVHGNREDHGGVPLCGDLSQRLQVAELESGWRLGHDVRRLLQRARGLHLPLSSYHLHKTNRMSSTACLLTHFIGNIQGKGAIIFGEMIVFSNMYFLILVSIFYNQPIGELHEP